MASILDPMEAHRAAVEGQLRALPASMENPYMRPVSQGVLGMDVQSELDILPYRQVAPLQEPVPLSQEMPQPSMQMQQAEPQKIDYFAALSALGQGLSSIGNVLDERYLTTAQLQEKRAADATRALQAQNAKLERELEERRLINDSYQFERNLELRAYEAEIQRENLAIQRMMLQGQMTGQNIENMLKYRELGQTQGAGDFRKALASQQAQSAAEIISSTPDFDVFSSNLENLDNFVKKIPENKLTPAYRAMRDLGSTLKIAPGDEDIVNLRSQLADLATRMRTIVKMPASGFSDADAQRLDRIVAGEEDVDKKTLTSIINRIKEQANITRQSQERILKGIGQSYESQNIETQIPYLERNKIYSIPEGVTQDEWELMTPEQKAVFQ